MRAEATDGSGAAVRVILFDYRKSFDLVDHNLLVRKVFNLSIPRSVACWVADFLMRRQQRVKLFAECYSEWGPLSSNWLFILMINEFRVSTLCTWKYVNDTTVAKIVPRGLQGDIQGAVDIVEGWSQMQGMQLNATNTVQ